jgi:SH3 domain
MLRIMPEYVYALHDFQPENEDEVAFRPGERIEVLERDDEFGDGWWKVSSSYLYI